MKADSNTTRPKITVSKETTYVTGALRADGYVDYVAALNQRFSEGVTPENNAVIPFWQAFGPKEIDKKDRQGYFQLLGIPELPEEGAYLVPFDEIFPLRKDWKQPTGELLADDAWAEYDRAMSGPWSKDECPLVAALLEEQRETVTDARRRSAAFTMLLADGAIRGWSAL